MGLDKKPISPIVAMSRAINEVIFEYAPNITALSDEALLDFYRIVPAYAADFTIEARRRGLIPDGS